MKILFFTPVNLSYGGGFERWIKSLITFLKKEGHSIHIIDADYPYHSKVSWLNSDERTTIHTKKFHIITRNEFNKIKRLSKDYDILYFNYVNMGHELLFRKLNIKTIVGYHAPIIRNHFIYDNYFNLIASKILRKFKFHHVLNSSDKTFLEKKGFNKVFLIHSGIDTDKFKCKKNNSKRLRVLFTGRHELQKGFDLLIKAIDKLDDISFTFTGRGTLTPLLINLMNKKKNVKYVGYVKNISKYYCKHDVLIVPSRQETFGLIIAEGQSAGLIVISSINNGSNDLIINGKTGFLLKELSVDEIVNKIRFVNDLFKNNKDKINRIRLNARKSVINKFSLKVMNKNLLKMFKYVYSL